MPLHFDGIARVGLYCGTLRQMVLAFKNGRAEYDAPLARLAQAALEGVEFSGKIELFVPVPLHWSRRLVRGYNQSALLARRIAGKSNLVSTDLVRVRRTRPQSQMTSVRQRAENVADAFAVRADHHFTGRTICLVDDVKTSGATLNECARTLKQAGAANVFAVVVAVAGQDN